ncbi:MAG: CRISPR-associated endonuclease Cas1 [Candidatus Helarchaeota archaeon]
MIYVFNEPGTYIGKKSQTLNVKLPDNQKKQIAVKNISNVVIDSRVQISYDALMLLARNGISVVFTQQHRPTGVFHPFATHGTVLTRREQILAYTDNRGVYLAKQFAKASLENKARLLLRLRKPRINKNPEIAQRFKDVVDRIRYKIKELENIGGRIDDVRWNIMGVEGSGAREYFQALQMIIPNSLGFSGRERRPPRDPVNSCLSYGYTILYGYILIGIAAAGLEPFAGFLHSDRSGKPSLALDLIEEFRQIIIDRLILKLFIRRILTNDDFDAGEGPYFLNAEGKKKFFEHFHEDMDGGVKQNGETRTFMQLIIGQARKLVRYLIGKSPTYDFFLIPW